MLLSHFFHQCNEGMHNCIYDGYHISLVVICFSSNALKQVMTEQYSLPTCLIHTIYKDVQSNIQYDPNGKCNRTKKNTLHSGVQDAETIVFKAAESVGGLHFTE